MVGSSFSLLIGNILLPNEMVRKNQNHIMATRNSDSLIISWDLWQTPLERLDVIRNLWEC